MVDQTSFNSAWNSGAQTLPMATGGKPPVSSAEFENKFALLKEESARTLALIKKFSASPLYRMTSANPR